MACRRVAGRRQAPAGDGRAPRPLRARAVLASLIRPGDAHSPRTADAAGQQVIFEDDFATHLPRCELTGATTDLHLVV